MHAQSNETIPVETTHSELTRFVFSPLLMVATPCSEKNIVRVQPYLKPFPSGKKRSSESTALKRKDGGCAKTCALIKFCAHDRKCAESPA